MLVLFLAGTIYLISSNEENYMMPDRIRGAVVEASRFSSHGRINEMSSVAAPIAIPPFTREMHIAEITDTQYLKLVNRDLAITNHTCHTRLTTVWPDMNVSGVNVKLHETAFYAMGELFAHAQSSGINDLFIASGYRSHEDQSRLYVNMANSDYVMPPGHSEHQIGLAADILSGDGSSSMRGSAEAAWLRENAPDFGFILRYPEDRQHITGVPYEPWHFRYVGRLHAWYMGIHSFVLEEYIEYLKENDVIRTEFDGNIYYILYQTPHDGIIFVPENMNFWVSSANTGGYIVTTWR